jgi:transcriptional regulator with XRE-family HTH domain
MPARMKLIDLARATVRRIRIDIGNEVRVARVGASVSQRAAGARVRMSHSQFGRIERAELENVTVDQLSRACAAVGLKLIIRSIPIADPALDAGQLALLGRFRAVLPSGTRFRTEVPLPIPGDLRAWDGIAYLDRNVAVEAETRPRDIQAVERRCALKARDGGIDIVVLLLADTAANRAMLDAHREDLRAMFPLDGRQILPDLRAGRTPAESGIVVL